MVKKKLLPAFDLLSYPPPPPPLPGLGWPLNYHLVFVMCAVISVASVLLSCLMPKSIEKKRES